MISIVVNTSGAEATLARLKAGLTPEAIDPIVDEVAMRTLAQVVAATPKKWFGQVRRSWQVEKPMAGARLVKNDNKIMWFLEKGTKDHGPVKAKAMFIPLTRKAAMAPRMPGSRVRAFKGKGGSTALKWGVDYILTKWVKGIAARGIAAAQAKETDVMLKAAMEQHIRGLVNG